MKTVLRIFIILAVALAICAVALVIANHNDIVSAHVSEGEGGPGSSEGIKGAGLGSGQGRGGNRQGNGDSEPGLNRDTIHENLPWLETVRDLVIVAVFILLVTFIERMIKKGKKRNRLNPASQ